MSGQQFRVGDKVRIAHVARVKWTLAAQSEQALDNRTPVTISVDFEDGLYEITLPDGARDVFAADELELVERADTITVPLDAFDALLSERDHNAYLYRTAQHIIIETNDTLTEQRDQLRAELDAANAKVGALEGELDVWQTSAKLLYGVLKECGELACFPHGERWHSFYNAGQLDTIETFETIMNAPADRATR